MHKDEITWYVSAARRRRSEHSTVLPHWVSAQSVGRLLAVQEGPLPRATPPPHHPTTRTFQCFPQQIVWMALPDLPAAEMAQGQVLRHGGQSASVINASDTSSANGPTPSMLALIARRYRSLLYWGRWSCIEYLTQYLVAACRIVSYLTSCYSDSDISIHVYVVFGVGYSSTMFRRNKPATEFVADQGNSFDPEKRSDDVPVLEAAMGGQDKYGSTQRRCEIQPTEVWRMLTFSKPEEQAYTVDRAGRMYWHWIIRRVWGDPIVGGTCESGHVVYRHELSYLVRDEQSGRDDNVFACPGCLGPLLYKSLFWTESRSMSLPILKCTSQTEPWWSLPVAGIIGEMSRSEAQTVEAYRVDTLRYSYSMLVAAEVSAAAVVIEYWTEKVPVAAWCVRLGRPPITLLIRLKLTCPWRITIILAVIIILNVFVVSWYGESEFWFASIKIIAILGLIILGIVLFFGGGPNHDRLGFRYWKNGQAFKPYVVSGDTGKFLAFWTALVRSGFAFILSPELICIAAGESEAPRRNIPKAGSRFIYRLIVFYVLGSLVISVIVSSNDSDLLQAVSSGTSNAGASPFVLGIQRAGIPVLNHIINGVILTSAWSAGNSFLFAASRSLYSLALTGQAPKVGYQFPSPQGLLLMTVLDLQNLQ